MEQQLSTLNEFPEHQVDRSSNVEVFINPLDQNAEEEEEEEEEEGGDDTECEIDNLIRVLPPWVKPHMVYS